MADVGIGSAVRINEGKRKDQIGTIVSQAEREYRWKIRFDDCAVVEYPKTKFDVVRDRDKVSASRRLSAKGDQMFVEASSPVSVSHRRKNHLREDSPTVRDGKEQNMSSEDSDDSLLDQVIVAKDPKGGLGIDVNRNLKVIKVKTDTATNAGLEKGQIIVKAHGIRVRTVKDLVDVLKKGRSPVVILMVRAAPRTSVKNSNTKISSNANARLGGLQSSSSSNSMASPGETTAKMPQRGRRSALTETYKDAKRKYYLNADREDLKQAAVDAKIAMQSAIDELEEFRKRERAKSIGGSRPSNASLTSPRRNYASRDRAMSMASSASSSSMVEISPNMIQAVETWVQEMTSTYKSAKKAYYKDTTNAELKRKAMEAKLNMHDAQKELESLKAQFTSDQTRRSSTVAMPSCAPPEVPKRPPHRHLMQSSSRDFLSALSNMNSESDVVTVPALPVSRSMPLTKIDEDIDMAVEEQKSSKFEKRTVLVGELKKKGNSILSSSWKTVDVKLDTYGITYSRLGSGLLMGQTDGRAHRTVFSEIKSVGQLEGAATNPNLGKRFEILFHDRRKPWVFETDSVEACMEWTSKIYYARAKAKEQERPKDLIDDLVKSHAVFDALEPYSFFDLGIVGRRSMMKSWKLMRLLCNPDSGMFFVQTVDRKIDDFEGEKWFVSNATIEAVKGTIHGFVSRAIQIIGARSDSRDEHGVPEIASTLELRFESDVQFAIVLRLLKSIGSEVNGKLCATGRADGQARMSIDIMSKQREELMTKKYPPESVWNSDDAIGVCRYVDAQVTSEMKASEKKRRTSSNAATRFLRAASSPGIYGNTNRRASAVERAMDLYMSNEVASVGVASPIAVSRKAKRNHSGAVGCLGYAVVRCDTLNVFQPTQNSRRRRLIIEEANLSGLLILKAETVACVDPSYQLFAVSGARLKLVDIFSSKIELETTLVNACGKPLSKHSLSVSFDLEGGIEHLHFVLHHFHATAAFLDHRCNLVLSIVGKLIREAKRDGGQLSTMLQLHSGSGKGGKSGGWVKLSSVVNADTINVYRSRIDMEFKSQDFQKKYLRAAVVSANDAGGDVGKVPHVSRDSNLDVLRHDQEMMRSRVAIFVLGPSASGKTFMTRRLLSRVLRANGRDPGLEFVSIDGGLMRDESDVWNEMKRLAHMQKKRLDGFSDLFSEYFSRPIKDFKRKVFLSLAKQGVNMVIPETAVRKGKVTEMMDTLNDAGYTVIMTVVHASKRDCTAAGRKREISEGKRYSSMSWMLAIYNVQGLFEYARDLGFRRETFFCIDNTDHKHTEVVVVPPYHSVHFTWKSRDGTSRGHATVHVESNVPFDMMEAIIPWTDVEMRHSKQQKDGSTKCGKWQSMKMTLRGVRNYAMLMWETPGSIQNSASGSYSQYDDFSRGFGSDCAFLDLSQPIDAYTFRKDDSASTKRRDDGIKVGSGGGFLFTKDAERSNKSALEISDSIGGKGSISISFYSSAERDSLFEAVGKCLAAVRKE
eukprot:g1966.t1